MTKKKIDYLLSKHTVRDVDVYSVIKEFFKEYLGAKYEFTFHELKKELKRVYIEKTTKDRLFGILEEFSTIEYKDDEIPQEAIRKVLTEFDQILDAIISSTQKQTFFSRLFGKKKKEVTKPSLESVQTNKNQSADPFAVKQANVVEGEHKTQQQTKPVTKQEFEDAFPKQSNPSDVLERYANGQNIEKHPTDEAKHEKEDPFARLKQGDDPFSMPNDDDPFPTSKEKTKQDAPDQIKKNTTNVSSVSGNQTKPQEQSQKESLKANEGPSQSKDQTAGIQDSLEEQTSRPSTNNSFDFTSDNKTESKQKKSKENEFTEELAQKPKEEEELPWATQEKPKQDTSNQTQNNTTNDEVDLGSLAEKIDKVITQDDHQNENIIVASDMQTLIQRVQRLIQNGDHKSAKNGYKELLGRYDELKDEEKALHYENIQRLYQTLQSKLQ